MADRGELVSCGRHGARPAAFVCRHVLEGLRTGARVGFHTPNDAANDDQAWCDACERVRAREGEMEQPLGSLRRHPTDLPRLLPPGPGAQSGMLSRTRRSARLRTVAPARLRPKCLLSPQAPALDHGLNRISLLPRDVTKSERRCCHEAPRTRSRFPMRSISPEYYRSCVRSKPDHSQAHSQVCRRRAAPAPAQAACRHQVLARTS